MGPAPACLTAETPKGGTPPAATHECRNAVASYLVAIADREFYAAARIMHREDGTGPGLGSPDTISRVLEVVVDGATVWEVSKSFSDTEEGVAERSSSQNRQRGYSAWGLLLRGVRGIFGWGDDQDSAASLIAKMELNRRAVLDKITASRSASMEEYPMTSMLADIERYLYFGDVDVATGM